MNLPSELILERFRCFESATTLPLSPITLVYGANNSGKSSLLRALALVGEALEADARSPAPLPERAFPNGQFGSLAWQGEAARYDWSVGLRWAEGGLREVKFTP
ncbi:MAG: AAA family ATPase [Deltaproteobacteria bacterium]|nr:AAA family ATPase [Deltaproteobacteria bacterium]